MQKHVCASHTHKEIRCTKTYLSEHGTGFKLQVAGANQCDKRNALYQQRKNDQESSKLTAPASSLQHVI